MRTNKNKLKNRKNTNKFINNTKINAANVNAFNVNVSNVNLKNKIIKKRKGKTIKMKGGFSDFFSVWDTMTYNLSSALSTFTISPPTAVGNVSNPIDPSVSKQFLQVGE